MFRKLYHWVLAWADTRYGTPALGIVAFVESSVFPVPPDLLLIALCVGKPSRSFFYAAVCSIMSVLGGMLGYLIGWGFWELMSEFFMNHLISQSAFDTVSVMYQKNEFIAIFASALTPIPYKVFTITAGVFKLNFGIFVLASVLGRSARFFVVATLIYFFGNNIKEFIEKYFELLTFLFIILLTLGFLVVKFLF